MKPTLGILITYYNERELLRECLMSIKAQREKPDEILIYDDASEFPAEDYVPAGMDAHVIHAEVNGGPARGRNRLMGCSGSDYIHFHDADDLFHPDWARRVRHVIEDTETDVVFTEMSSYESNKKVAERVLDLKRLRAEPDLIRFCLQGAMVTTAGTYRRNKILALGGYRESLWQSEDFDFHIRLANAGLRYEIIEDPLIFVRLREASRSRDLKSVWRCALQSLEYLSRELPNRYLPDLSEKAAFTGSMLYRLGDRGQARLAFKRAKEWGKPMYRSQGRLYRWVAQTCGPELAERAGLVYRKLLPTKWRELSRSLARV